uniref:mitogen-activated protein kinase kinase n=1 Tax=Acrobeloides nanus TaxID=290746 RepID=A0A914DN05_9BILA
MDSLNLNEEIKRLYPVVNLLKFPTGIIRFKYEDFTFGQILGKQVREATHMLIKQKMAVKFVPLFIALENDQNKISEQISEQCKEVTMLRELSKHENIVDFYGFCLHKENLLICMEVMDMSLRGLAFHAHKHYDYFPEEWLGVITVSVIKALRFCKNESCIVI